MPGQEQQEDWRNSLAWRLFLAIGLPVAGLLGGLILYLDDPAAGRSLMPCLFYQMTGIHCIGCGTTRALHALLHGDLAAAVSYNVFMLIWLPLPIYALLAVWLRALTGRPLLPAIRDWRWLMIILLVSGVLFFILRNLPWEPFNWLAP
ncbi:MAG TPA: DUF2752 domain-containing protein [Clostridiales bacterium]|nr:DUF2752 domain-containing protein [Clostridiales bacterium]